MVHKIDGETFMVGVIDLTEICLSSVYLFYDPKFEFLSPGTLAALREIEYIKRMHKLSLAPPSFNYYYMGLYFQNCQKSVYKANFKPSQLACPQTFNFVYITDEVREKINKAKMPRLAAEDAKPTFDVPHKAALEKGMRA